MIRPGPEEGLIFVGICEVAEGGDLHWNRGAGAGEKSIDQRRCPRLRRRGSAPGGRQLRRDLHHLTTEYTQHLSLRLKTENSFSLSLVRFFSKKKEIILRSSENGGGKFNEGRWELVVYIVEMGWGGLCDRVCGKMRYHGPGPPPQLCTSFFVIDKIYLIIYRKLFRNNLNTVSFRSSA